MSQVQSEALRPGWPAVAQGIVGPAGGRAVLVAALAVALLAGSMASDAAATARAAAAAGPDLVRLLRGMALLKSLMSAAVVAAILWRLGRPVPPAWLCGYATVAMAMAAGPALIWNLAHVASGAALLHAGLLAGLLLLWRDPATGSRLAALVAHRRAALARRSPAL